MNETIARFGYPETLVAEYESWVVLLRPRQVTLGSTVLACKEAARALGDVSTEAWAEVARVTSDLEQAVREAFGCERLNYLALMMVDPHVHFHVLPRYESPRELAGVAFVDAAWPKPPDVTASLELADGVLAAIGERLRASWPS